MSQEILAEREVKIQFQEEKKRFAQMRMMLQESRQRTSIVNLGKIGADAADL